MLNIFDSLRNMDMVSVLVRMCMSFLCGALIGFERSYRNQTAGLRTHILVCLAGTLAAATGQYLYLVQHYPTDVTRIGAYVAAGLGFVAGGRIIIAKHKSTIGLITAAGLWTTGIIGLACGAGFYEGAILATVLILITETFFCRISMRMPRGSSFTIIIEYPEKETIDRVMRWCKDHHLIIDNLRVTISDDGEGSTWLGQIVLSSKGEVDKKVIVENIRSLEGVIWVDEL